jgi:hypothetical protein
MRSIPLCAGLLEIHQFIHRILHLDMNIQDLATHAEEAKQEQMVTWQSRSNIKRMRLQQQPHLLSLIF